MGRFINGGGIIQTHEGLVTPHTFQACAFNRSATLQIHSIFPNSIKGSIGSFSGCGRRDLPRRPSPWCNRAYAMYFALSIEISYTGHGCDKGGRHVLWRERCEA